MQQIKSGRTPELPLARELARTSIDARTHDSGIHVELGGSVVGNALAKMETHAELFGVDRCGGPCKSMMPYCSVSTSDRCKP